MIHVTILATTTLLNLQLLPRLIHMFAAIIYLERNTISIIFLHAILLKKILNGKLVLIINEQISNFSNRFKLEPIIIYYLKFVDNIVKMLST